MKMISLRKRIITRTRNIYRRYFKTIQSPIYKEIDIKEKEKEYNTAIKDLVSNAEKYRFVLPDDFISTVSKEELKDYRVIISLLDPLGPVLVKEKEEITFYRGILPDKVLFFKELYECGVLQSLAEAGHIVKIKLTNYYTKKYPLIIQMETFVVVPPNFWTFSMIRESATNMLIISHVLKQFGYNLLDGHPFNSTFLNNNPVFFDIGSCIKGKKEQFQKEFVECYLNTLLMMSIKKSYFARYNISFSSPRLLPPIIEINDSIELNVLRNIFLKYHAKYSCGEYNSILKKVFINKEIKPEYIDILFKDRPREKTMWEDYSNQYVEQTEPTKRQNRILELINQFSPDAKSSLDIAGNSGYFSSLLDKTKQFDSIISVDYDENAIEKGRIIFKNTNVTLYLLNPFIPPFLNGKYDEITSKIKSDVVLALALTHHLILTNQFHIDAIFSIISLYSKKHIYIEFCPLGLYGGQNKLPEIPEWYTEVWFEENFRNHFNLLHKEAVETIIVAGEEKVIRILFIGEKK
jgi:hypothetical protein